MLERHGLTVVEASVLLVIADNPQVRLKIGERIYRATATQVQDAVEYRQGLAD